MLNYTSGGRSSALIKHAFHETHVSTAESSLYVPIPPGALLLIGSLRFSKESQFSGAELIESHRGGETLQHSECIKPPPHFLILIYAEKVSSALDLFIFICRQKLPSVVLNGSAEGRAQLRSAHQENTASSIIIRQSSSLFCKICCRRIGSAPKVLAC